ncbi:hypothetical protein BDK51DRAFT_47598 [Blyttiomyces helicus]|uniref:GH26 domain-containing protein n=1 Tax=Blyttiomyces helicus TaxID=388810 RepID=A0A4P9W4E1_9FUNG|nr:hypothetical protein BDK51DRAFT_47598 [Blyttiomyces helicus]|eukprot:RKO86762.1 hypothetical protein BDK51DRAFT_47598 [Blyttiomyces helicus]
MKPFPERSPALRLLLLLAAATAVAPQGPLAQQHITAQSTTRPPTSPSPTPSSTSPPAPSASPVPPPQELAPLEPPDGKILLGAWVNTVQNGDSPLAVNDRLQAKLPMFHFQMNIPESSLDESPPLQMLDQTDTDALLYLSALPNSGLAAVGDADLDRLVERCKTLNLGGRRVLLRFAPGFNAAWVPWGQQPLEFVSLWKNLTMKVRESLNSNLTALVWAPYSGDGYPFSGFAYSAKPGTADFQTLDTDVDGNLTVKDDPYGAFWPGAEYVDWVGLTAYHRGAAYPWVTNAIPYPSYVSNLLLGKLPSMPATADFYNSYVVKYNKPMMIAETGAVFHKNATTGADAPGPDYVAIKSAWMDQLLGASTHTAFPRLKAICLYEFEVIPPSGHEAGLILDFELTNSSRVSTLNALRNYLHNSSRILISANSTTPNAINSTLPVPSSTAGPNPSPFGSQTSSSVPRWAIVALVIFPIAGVAFWCIVVIVRHRKGRAPSGAADAAQHPSSSLAMEMEKGEESDVDDSATIVNVGGSDAAPSLRASISTIDSSAYHSAAPAAELESDSESGMEGLETAVGVAPDAENGFSAGHVDYLHRRPVSAASDSAE